MAVVKKIWRQLRGINRLLSRSALPDGDLWEAKGVVSVERGRLRPIWEGEAVSKYGERSLTWPAMDATATRSNAAPEQLTLWLAARRAAATSRHAGGFDGSTGVFYTAPQQQTYTGVSVATGDDSLTLTLSAPVPWMSRIVIDDGQRRHEHTALSAHPYTTPATAVVHLDRQYTGTTTSSATVTIDTGGRCWVVDFGDWLVICPERQPARAVHKSQVDETSLAQFTASAGDADSAEVAHVPVWLSTAWYRQGQATLSWWSPHLTAASAAFRTSGNDLHGYGATMPTNWQSYVTSAVLYGRDQQEDPDKALTLGFRLEVAADTTADLTPGGTSPVVYNATSDVPYRIAYPGMAMRYRMPAIYRGRLVAAEGRYMERRSGYNAGAGVVATINTIVAKDPVYLDPADITGKVQDGDWLVIYDTSAVEANVDVATTGVYAARVQYVRYSGGATYLYLDVPTNFFSGAPGTSVLFHVFRPLTSAQRRRVWFTGRPANSAAGVSRNDQDFMWLDDRNNVIVGDDSEGDITALVPQGDDRLIVGLESAIYEIVGDPPIDGTPPPGFGVRRLASGVGIYTDTAAAWDDSGQVLYFCSGTDFGLHRLSGSAVDDQRVDAEIWDHPKHPRHRGVGFRYVAVSDRRLWALTDEDAPVLWCLDLQTGGWTWTDRANSASGQTGANPAVDPSDPSYTGTPNYLYESGNHGGIWAPFRRVASESDRLLVCYRDSGTYKMRSIADSAAVHNNGALLHGVELQTPTIPGDDGPVRVRAAHARVSQQITTSAGGQTLDGMIMSATDGEGQTTWSRTLSGADYVDSGGESARYYAAGQPGRGDDAPAVTIGDGVAPTGEIAEIAMTAIPTRRRRR